MGSILSSQVANSGCSTICMIIQEKEAELLQYTYNL